MSHRFLLLCTTLFVTACAQNTPPSDVVRICDDRGCAMRSVNEATFAAEPPTPTDPRMASLIELAEKDPRAAYDLGLRYFRGDGVGQDSYKALTWMRKAAEGGDLQAQKALGNFYFTGLEEMGADPREAEKWLTIAAARGDKESKKLLPEVAKAKKADEDDYKWRMELKELRALYSSYWYSGYAYRGSWNGSSWYWR
jgi:TPR repeat protein